MPDIEPDPGYEYIGPLDDLKSLVAGWRKHADSLQPLDDFGRLAGVKSGLQVCADQLAETIERMLADA